jgi:hypothetical protein
VEAQKYGINPGTAHAEITRQMQLERNQAQADATMTAMAVLGGMTDASQSAISGLTAGLSQPTAQAMQMAAIAQEGQRTLGQLAAGQQDAINRTYAQLIGQKAAGTLNAQLGFPTEYLQGLNQAGFYGNAQGLVGNYANYLAGQRQSAQNQSNFQSWLDVMRQNQGGGGNTLSGFSSQPPPASSGTGYGAGWSDPNWNAYLSGNYNVGR